MAYISQFEYYENDGVAPEDANWGSYQYISLQDIVNNFLLMYSGNHSLVNNEERYKILFHAKRAVQELNYDAFKEIKVLELTVTDTLRYILPSDFVNWVRISLYKDGWLRPLSENIQTLSAKAYLQDQQGRILFDMEGNALSPEFSSIDLDRIEKTKKSIEADIQKDFDDGLTGIKNLPKKSRFGVYVAYVYYLALFKKIENTPASVILNQRIRISNNKKYALFVTSYLRHLFNAI
jgi:hypothetical protein